MRATGPILVVLLGAAASIMLASCGSGSDAKLLPGRTAEEIEANLEEVQRMAGEGECVGARDAAQQIGAEVERLAVDAQLKRALGEGTERLDQVLASCDEASEEEAEEETEPLTAEEEAPEKAGKAEKQLEKEEEREAKEAEKAEHEAEKEAEQEEAEGERQEAEEESEFAPPAAGGPKGKGPEGTGPPGQGGGPSGGLGPGVAAGGGG